MRADRGVHLHRHLGPCLAGQRDQPVDSRGLAARIALRDLAHAHQNVEPAPQHQLLQVPDSRQVPVLDRLEDPASQPPYLLLAAPPVHKLPGVAIEDRPCRSEVLRSVHRGVQLALRFQHLLPLRLKGSPAHVSALAGPGIRPYPASYAGAIRGRSRCRDPCFPAAFRPPAFASWAPCPVRGFRPTYDRPTAQPALTRACRADPDEVYTFRTHETRTGPGVLYTPGTAVFASRRPVRGRRLPPLSGQPLAPRYNDPARGVSVTRHQQGFPDSRPIPVLPLTCDRHGWNGGPWAFP